MSVYMSNSVKNVFIVNMRHMGNGVCSVKHFLEVLFVCDVSFCFASVASQAESLLRFTLGALGQRLFRLFHLGLDHKSQVITTWWSHHPCRDSRYVPELRFRSVMLVFVKPDCRSWNKNPNNSKFNIFECSRWNRWNYVKLSRWAWSFWMWAATKYLIVSFFSSKFPGPQQNVGQDLGDYALLTDKKHTISTSSMPLVSSRLKLSLFSISALTCRLHWEQSDTMSQDFTGYNFCMTASSIGLKRFDDFLQNSAPLSEMWMWDLCLPGRRRSALQAHRPSRSTPWTRPRTSAFTRFTTSMVALLQKPYS